MLVSETQTYYCNARRPTCFAVCFAVEKMVCGCNQPIVDKQIFPPLAARACLAMPSLQIVQLALAFKLS